MRELTSIFMAGMVCAFAAAVPVTDGAQSCDNPLYASHARWSPGGERLVFYVQDPSGGRDIWMYAFDTQSVTRITTTGLDGVSNVDPTFSAGGNRIVFASDMDGDYEIYVMNDDGSDVQQLTSNTAVDRGPHVRPGTGGLIAFTSDRTAGYEVYTMNNQGGQVVRRTFNGGPNGDPVFSSDGNFLTFHSAVDGDFELVVLDLAEGTIIPVTNNGTNEGFPSFSPDGVRLAYVGDSDGDFDLYTIPTEGGPPQNLTPGIDYENRPSFSPDGSMIAYTTDAGGICQIFVIDAFGGEPIQLTFPEDFELPPVPAGSPLLFGVLAALLGAAGVVVVARR